MIIIIIKLIYIYILIKVILIIFVTVINSQKIVYQCDFDDSTINNGCNGEFSYSINGQQAGPFQYIEGVSTDLGFDVTDLTSISIFYICFIIYSNLILILIQIISYQTQLVLIIKHVTFHFFIIQYKIISALK